MIRSNQDEMELAVLRKESRFSRLLCEICRHGKLREEVDTVVFEHLDVGTRCLVASLPPDEHLCPILEQDLSRAKHLDLEVISDAVVAPNRSATTVSGDQQTRALLCLLFALTWRSWL